MLNARVARGWTLVLAVPGEHRYFTREGDPRIYIADQSGPTPDRTEDGRLWLDPSAPITVLKSTRGDFIGLALLGPNGLRSQTVLSPVEMVLVAAHFGLSVAVVTSGDERVFTIARFAE